jgi:hypothetical protein
LGTDDRNSAIVSRINETDQRLNDALLQFIDPDSTAEEDPVGRPIKINSKLVALQASVERSEGRPAPQSFEVFNLLKEQTEKSVAAELALERQDVAELNKFLSEQGVMLLQPAAENQEHHQ